MTTQDYRLLEKSLGLIPLVYDQDDLRKLSLKERVSKSRKINKTPNHHGRNN